DPAVEIEFHMHFERAGALNDEGAFRSRAEGDGAGDTLGLDGFDLVQAAAGDEILTENVVNGLCRRRKNKKKRDNEKREFAHGGFRVCGVAGRGIARMLDAESARVNTQRSLLVSLCMRFRLSAGCVGPVWVSAHLSPAATPLD